MARCTVCHFQSNTILYKALVWEGSQPEEWGQDKSRTDRGPVLGQGWRSEPKEGSRQQPCRETCILWGSNCANKSWLQWVPGPAWRLAFYPSRSPWDLADNSLLASEISTSTSGWWWWELLARHGQNDPRSSGIPFGFVLWGQTSEWLTEREGTLSKGRKQCVKNFSREEKHGVCGEMCTV